MSDAPQSDQPTREEIDELKGQLVAQDHRLLSILKNIATHRGGKFESQAWTALGGWALSALRTAGIVGLGGGLLALLTYCELQKQTTEITRQSFAIEEQNKKFDQQLQQESEADFEVRKAQLLAIIYDTEQRWPWSAEGPSAPIRARAEAVQSYYKLIRDRNPGAVVYLSTANLTGAYLADANLNLTRLDEANLCRANLYGANLFGANLFGANLTEAHLRKADLAEAMLARGNLAGVSLASANLELAVLTEANLRGANLAGANLSWTLLDADLTGADLTDAKLYKADLTGAKYSSTTRWPEGFDPIAAGAILVDENGDPVEQEDGK